MEAIERKLVFKIDFNFGDYLGYFIGEYFYFRVGLYRGLFLVISTRVCR